ncbi:MAG: type II toxin-antitoxin system HicB family antitoxin [Armatimonadetes bacterium]|nr:type II toxin-antitoxin system HicB family antitoxin [Armatimonadota bacterium]
MEVQAVRSLLHRYPPTITPDEDGYLSVRFADFPGIVTGGETFEAAMDHAAEALALMVGEYEERGMPLPEPVSEVSGHFNVRVPRAVHRALKQRAAAEGVSLNALVSHLLSHATASRRE